MSFAERDLDRIAASHAWLAACVGGVVAVLVDGVIGGAVGVAVVVAPVVVA